MKSSIGIFDSGIGGLSILEKLKEKLPHQNFIYLADNLNCPYGNKTKEEIFFLSHKNCKKLIEFNCKIIVIACNTATTNSIKKIREIISIPIIGIEPPIKPAINYTKTKNIGILATENTLNSKLFFKTLSENRIDNINIHEKIGYQLVNMIEEGLHSKSKILKILKSYLNPMISENIDCLLLGCTHYNHVTDIIKELLPNDIKILDTIEAVNRQVLNQLKSHDILNISTKNRNIKVFYNGRKLSKKFLKKSYDLNYLRF